MTRIKRLADRSLTIPLQGWTTVIVALMPPRGGRSGQMGTAVARWSPFGGMGQFEAPSPGDLSSWRTTPRLLLAPLLVRAHELVRVEQLTQPRSNSEDAGACGTPIGRGMRAGYAQSSPTASNR
jgi:hypothetical protein